MNLGKLRKALRQAELDIARGVVDGVSADVLDGLRREVEDLSRAIEETENGLRAREKDEEFEP
jgi:hypothetical protein